MTVLVTGGAGFIGSHVCQCLIERGDRVVCVDNFNDYYEPRFKEENVKDLLKSDRFTLYKIDITDVKAIEHVFANNNIQKVIHLAARAGVRNSLKEPDLYHRVNVAGTKNMLNLATKYGVQNFIFASSSSVYGVNTKIPFCETDAIENLVSPYARTKKDGEILCKKHHDETDLKITCLRFFTVYGPRGRPDMAPYKFVERVSKGEPIDIYLDEADFDKGTMARDFTFVQDIVDGIILALDKNLEFEIINLGRGQPIKLNEFISVIETCVGKKACKNFVGRQTGDVPLTYADISKARRLLGYNPHVSINEGIARFVEWYKNERATSLFSRWYKMPLEAPRLSQSASCVFYPLFAFQGVCAYG